LWGKSPANANLLAALIFVFSFHFLWDCAVLFEYGGRRQRWLGPSTPTDIILKDNSWMFGIYVQG